MKKGMPDQRGFSICYASGSKHVLKSSHFKCLRMSSKHDCLQLFIQNTSEVLI